MQIHLIAVGKVRESYIAQACADFARRLQPYYPLEIAEVRAGNGEPPAVMREEAARLLAQIQPGDRVWLLERTGDAIDSPQLSRRLQDVANDGVRRLCVIIGGTFGVAAPVRDAAHFVWSLSPLTFLHEWARALVLEQLYRAAKIARNEPYHH